MKKIIYSLLISLFIVSCNRAGEFWDNPNNSSGDENLAFTRSGAEQVSSDPYRLEVMQQAVNEVCESKGISSFTLDATNKYVKIKPDSLESVKLDSIGVIAYPHRLDTKVVESEHKEEGMTIPKEFSKTDWKYCVVPADYQFESETEYELMYEVFLRPENQTTRSAVNPQLTDELYREVLHRSLVNTGNIGTAISGRAAQAVWYPSARIMFEVGFGKDGKTLRYMPAVGMKVVARSYTNTLGAEYTNKNGETGSICSASVPVSYDVVCENVGWQLRNGESSEIMQFTTEAQRLTPLYINAKNRTVLNVFSAVTRAVCAYQQEEYLLTAGLSKQYQNLVIGVCNDDFGKWCNTTYAGRFIPQLGVPMLVYTNNGDGTERTAREVMGIAFHELGHVSHNIIESFNYLFRGHEKDGESWAEGVCYAYMASYFGDDYVSDVGSSDYTHVVECLMKNGFTLATVQNGFSRSRNWAKWHERMVARVSSSTVGANFVDLIFNNPNIIKFDLRKPFFKFTHPKVFRNEMAFLTIADGIPMHDVVTIDSVRFLHAGITEVIPNGLDKEYYRVLQMTSPGIKRVEVYSNLTKRWYPLEVNVNPEDIFQPLPERIVTNHEFKIGVRHELKEKDVKISDWMPSEYSTGSFNDNYEAAFRFNSPGKHVVKVTVNYRNSFHVDSIYEIEVDVEDFDLDKDLFQII